MANSYAIIGGFLLLVIIGLTVGLVLATSKKPSPALSGANQRMYHHQRMAQPPVRLNTAPVHTPEPLPPVREQHNFNVRFGQSREPLRNMMASDNEGAHLSAAIWNRESLIRKHKVIS